MLVLAMFVLLLLVFLLLLGFDPIALLHLTEAERVSHEGLIRCLLLLLDHKQRIFSHFRRSISDSIRMLHCDEVFMACTELWRISPCLPCETSHAYGLILVPNQNLIDTLSA